MDFCSFTIHDHTMREYVRLKDLENNAPSTIKSTQTLKPDTHQRITFLEIPDYGNVLNAPIPLVKPLDQSNLGLFYMFLGQIGFAAMALSTRALLIMENALPNLEIQFIRGLVGTFMAFTVLWHSKVSHPFGPPESRSLLLARGVFGWVSSLTLSFSLMFINAGEASVIQFLVPFLTGILAKFALKEPWGGNDAIICLVALSGVTISVRPWETPSLSSEYRFAGVALSLVSSVFAAISLIAIRILGPKTHVGHDVLYFHVLNIPLAPLMVPVLSFMQTSSNWRAPGIVEIILLLLSTSTGFFGQVMQSKALKLTNVGRASYMGYIRAIFSFLVEWAIWGVIPNSMTILGSLIICACLVANVLIKPK